MSFLKKQIEKQVENIAPIITSTLKKDVLMLLGEDARPQDVEIVSTYFDKGTAIDSVKKALKKNGVI